MKKIVILLLTLLLASVGVVYTTSSRQDKANQKRITKEGQREQARKIFKGFDNSRPKLPAVATAATTREVGTEIGVGLPILNPSDPPVNSNELLRSLTCSSDAIVIGRVKTQTSHLTEDETFIYTDYVVSVEEVIKNNADAPIQVSDNITVSRIGGKLNLNGKNVTAKHDAMLSFEPNQQHVLFLSFLPEKGSYVANTANGSFLLKKNKIVNLTQPVVGEDFQSGRDVNAFVNQIRYAAGNPCDGGTQAGGK